MSSITLSSNSVEILPVFLMIMFLSAVKIRMGRINESVGNEPNTKSLDVNFWANTSPEGCDVIWQSKISSPRIFAKTKAGRLLLGHP